HWHRACDLDPKRVQRCTRCEQRRSTEEMGGQRLFCLREGNDLQGKVYLIGAGPGDPELMTLKAARALGSADVVLIDELVSRGCLAHARSHAKVIEVGKRGGCKNTPQEFIERLLVQYARQGKIVARLKGGDPFVFGRGGAELEVLRAARIAVEAMPGITAG